MNKEFTIRSIHTPLIIPDAGASISLPPVTEHISNDALLMDVFPGIAEYWDFDSNGKNKQPPKGVRALSKKEYKWKCKIGHSFGSRPIDLVELYQTGREVCPYCGGRRNFVSKENCLTALHPDISREWFTEGNAGKTPDTVNDKTTTPYRWKCNNGHIYKMAPSDRVAYKERGGIACPYCDGRAKVSVPAVPLSQSHPHIAEHWDSKNNATKEPQEKITAFTQTPYMWICENGHSFRLSPKKYVKYIEEGKSPCQYCRNRRAHTSNSLKTLFPDIAKELAPDNKKGKSADRIFPDSKTKYFWICGDKGHRYSMAPFERIQYFKNGETACPYCAGRAVIPGETSLAALFPEIVVMWDSEENNPESTPNNIFPSSTREFSWKCLNGHHFKATPKKLISYMSEGVDLCPYCGERLASPEENSLSACHPDIAAEWCYEKNTGFNDPKKVFYNSLHAYWWRCSQNHEYMMTPSDRVRYKDAKGVACPYCDGRKLYYELSLLEMHPDISGEWCYEKNTNSKGPGNVSPYSKASTWWKCLQCNCLYNMSIADRVQYKIDGETACPYCSERKIRPENSLGALHPDISEEWVYEENLTSKGPMYISPVSSRYYSWKCHEGHVYRMSPAMRIKYKEAGLTSCPICDDRPVLELNESNNLAAVHPDIAAFWDYEGNPGFAGPHKVHYLATSTYAWKCELGHTYKISVSRQIELKEASIIACPYCDGRKVLRGFNSFAVRHSDLLSEWDDDIDPDTISEKSQTPVRWKCPDRGHNYDMPVYSRVDYKLAGKTACPYCDDRQVLPGFNSFAARHEDLLSEWDYVNNYALADPDKISPNSKLEVWFICKNNPTHRYPTTVENRINNKIRGREPCPYCKGRMRKRTHFMPIQKTKMSS